LYNSDGNDNDDSKTEKRGEPEVTNKWPEYAGYPDYWFSWFTSDVTKKIPGQNF
jgi:hypothetical protein